MEDEMDERVPELLLAYCCCCFDTDAEGPDTDPRECE